MEEWKQIPYEEEFEVSSKGRVRRIENQYIITPVVKKATGFLEVGLYCKATKKRTFYYIHRLVADMFCPKPNSTRFLEVIHVDGDRTNNDYENLCWVVRKYNTLYTRRKDKLNTRAVYCKELDRTFESVTEAGKYLTIRENRKNSDSVIGYLSDCIRLKKVIYGKYTFVYVE